MKLIIVTGLSGSGKSIVLRCLEDLGYYCVHNLPVRFLPAFSEWLLAQPAPDFRRTAIGIGPRNAAEDLQEVPDLIRGLRERDIACVVIFLDAREDVLIRRYSETRHMHPLTRRDRSLNDAIQLERRLLDPVVSGADLYVDTTETSVHQLRDLIRARLADVDEGQISLMFQSFGFKHSVPLDSDFVFDVRCLPNPYWHLELRPLTGRDPEVIRFLEAQSEVSSMLENLVGFLQRWIPRFEAEGRSYLTVAVGCTGGQHRSVYMVDRLAKHFQGVQRNVLTRHRDLSS